jgi:hypothetical protein
VICIFAFILSLISCGAPEHGHISTGERGNIRYPVFSSDNHNQDEVNALISQEVDRIIAAYSLCGASAESAVGYKIAHHDDSLLSVRFDGIICHSGAAYPVRVFGSISIDLTTAEILELNRIVDVESDAFFDYFVENANNQLNETALEDIYTVYTSEKIRELLKNADIRGDSLDSLSYISGENLVIRFRVIHALGDFLDFTLLLLQ